MPVTRLSTRLRELRTTEFGEVINQARLATALGVSSPSISAWENGSVPPPDRLRMCAVFFSSRRWLERDAPRPVDARLLTDEELARCKVLLGELTRLASGSDEPSAPQRPAFWRFPEGERIRVFCGRLDGDDAGPYADPAKHNYMRMHQVSDLDALFELSGYIRRLNPNSALDLVVGKDWRSADLEAHVVVLGNIAQSQGSGNLIPEDALPLRQVRAHADLDGEVFELLDSAGKPLTGEGTRFGPRFDEFGAVTQDVGLLARVPNPHRTDRTLTVCSGVFTRGVLGAVRATTTEELRTTNVAYLRERFDGADSFAILMRVRVAGSEIPTPDLRDRGSRLYEHMITIED